ncbi:MAG: carboxypeptidase regulatory-like domain-containing protein [Gemmatimonadales bacterium]
MTLSMPELFLFFALQGEQATVAGTIRSNDDGGGLAAAVVTLTEPDRTTTTDAQGKYAITGVGPGPHHMVIRRIGYTPRTLHALVPVSGTLEINVALSALPPMPARLPEVIVRRPIEMRGSHSAEIISLADKTASMKAVRNNPMLTQPDVLQSLSGGEITIKPESPGGVHIRGGSSDQTSYVVDGIPVFNPYHAAGIFSTWNPDALSHVSVASAVPSPDYPSTLSGTIAAFTRAPGSEISARSSVSSTHTALTVDGPTGFGKAGFLVSSRFAYPHLGAPPSDQSYVRGVSNDNLVKVGIPVLGGRLELLGYHGVNEIGTVAETDIEVQPGTTRPRNTFEWQSQSLGAVWARTYAATNVRLLGWLADGDAESKWSGKISRLMMTSDREDKGILLEGDRRFARSSLKAGVRLEQSRIGYLVEFDSIGMSPFGTRGTTSIVTLFTRYSAALGKRTDLRAGTSIISAAGAWYASPQAEVRWKQSSRLTSSFSFARTHQLVQSFRNAESITAAIFPADLFASSGSAGVPAARSDLAVIATNFEPTPDVRIGFQAWARRFNNILLVAPFDDEPFSLGGFGAGSGDSRGASIDASVSSTRYGLTASYGIQRVRYSSGSLEYVPDHGPTHLFEGGVLFFPTATSSIRIGIAHSAGRRTTAIGGQFEWEACNLRDGGCQFAGSPRSNGEPLGAQYLPAYFRADIGARKHWHLNIAGRDATIALFGAMTNIFDRQNILTYTRDPATGTLSPIDMRPRAPIVVGLEWRL